MIWVCVCLLRVWNISASKLAVRKYSTRSFSEYFSGLKAIHTLALFPVFSKVFLQKLHPSISNPLCRLSCITAGTSLLEATRPGFQLPHANNPRPVSSPTPQRKARRWGADEDMKRDKDSGGEGLHRLQLVHKLEGVVSLFEGGFYFGTISFSSLLPFVTSCFTSQLM